LYLGEREQDLALQRARLSLNQRLHLRLWTSVRFDGQPVWIGQVSRDIGVRFTLRTWNLSTHLIDHPDVDEARNYVLAGLRVAGRVARIGFVAGVEAAPATAPRHNVTGDQYFTDGLRAVAVLSRTRTTLSFLF
jgi:hypothetical protein